MFVILSFFFISFPCFSFMSVCLRHSRCCNYIKKKFSIKKSSEKKLSVCSVRVIFPNGVNLSGVLFQSRGVPGGAVAQREVRGGKYLHRRR